VNESNANTASFLAEKLKRMKGLSAEDMNTTLRAYLLNERSNHANSLADHASEAQVICLPGMRVV
jgi:hypothetical protein